MNKLSSFYVVPGYTFFYWGFSLQKAVYSEYIKFFNLNEKTKFNEIILLINGKKHKAKINNIYICNKYFSKNKNTLEFSLDRFEDYLQSQKINYERVDLVMKIQRILKAKKNRGKYKEKSLVSWKIDQPEIDNEDIILEGEFTENVGEIDFEA